MAYRRPTNRFMSNPFVQETQEYPYLPGAVTRRPASRFMADPFKSIPGVQPQALPYKPGMKPEPEDLKPQKPAYKRPAPKPVQGSAARSPMPAAPAPKQQSVFGDMNSLMSMMGGMDPEQMKQMRERFQRISDASISRQRNMLDKMNQRYESTLENKKGLLDLDWTPLLSLADNMTRPFNPTNYAQTYMQSSLRPESEMQRQRRLGQMEQGILAGERGLMNQEIQALQQGGMMGRSGNIMLREALRSMRDERKHQQILDRIDKREGLRDIRDTLTDSEKFLTKEMNLVFENKRDLQNISKGLEDGGVQRVQSVISSLSRLMGERGVLTEGDIGRQLFTTLNLQIDKIKAYIQSNPGKGLPPDTVNNLKATVRDAMGAARMKYKGTIGAKWERLQLNPRAGESLGNLRNIYDSSLRTVDQTFTTGGPKKSEKEQLLDELKKLEGK